MNSQKTLPKKDALRGSTSRIALIDADSVLYSVACQAEARSIGSGENGEDEWFQAQTTEQAYRTVVSKLEHLVEDVDASDAIICLTPTGSTQFRSLLLPTYKANRTGRRPMILKELQEMIQEKRPFGVLAVRGLEADDICGISSGNLQKAGLREPIIVSIDKDMLSVPGLSYSWWEGKRTIVETSEAQADRAHLYQTLIGDTTDNYTGLPGIGPKKANALLDSLEDAVAWSKWVWIAGLFAKKGFNEEYALTQARVARILRASDWNPKTREVTLWQPPMETTPASMIAAVGSANDLPKPGLKSPSIRPLSTTAPLRLRLDEILRQPGETVQ